MTTPEQNAYYNMMRIKLYNIREMCYKILNSNIPDQLNMNKHETSFFNKGWRKIADRSLRYNGKYNYDRMEKVCEKFLEKFEPTGYIKKRRIITLSERNARIKRVETIHDARKDKGNCGYYNRPGFNPEDMSSTGRRTIIRKSK